MTQNNSIDKILLGVSVTFALDIVISLLLFFLGGIFQFPPFIIAPFVIGLLQLLYIVPLIIWSIANQRWGFMKGVIIAAVITALLNGGCWLILFSSST